MDSIIFNPEISEKTIAQDIAAITDTIFDSSSELHKPWNKDTNKFYITLIAKVWRLYDIIIRNLRYASNRSAYFINIEPGQVIEELLMIIIAQLVI